MNCERKTRAFGLQDCLTWDDVEVLVDEEPSRDVSTVAENPMFYVSCTLKIMEKDIAELRAVAEVARMRLLAAVRDESASFSERMSAMLQLCEQPVRVTTCDLVPSQHVWMANGELLCAPDTLEYFCKIADKWNRALEKATR